MKEMPRGEEAVFERTENSGTEGRTGTGSASPKIVFNGIEYENVDEMPTYIRNLYERAMDAARHGNTSSDRSPTQGPGRRGAIKTEPSFPVESLIVSLLLGALLLLLYKLLPHLH